LSKRRTQYKISKIKLSISMIAVTPATESKHAICLWLSGFRAKQEMRPLLAHEVRPCLVCGEAVLVG
jgi:hypothetical protein